MMDTCPFAIDASEHGFKMSRTKCHRQILAPYMVTVLANISASFVAKNTAELTNRIGKKKYLGIVIRRS